MRFNDRITFIREFEGGFNPVTGEHEEPRIEDDERACMLSTMGINRTNELFGQVDKQIIVARTQQPYLSDIDYVTITKGNYQGKYNVMRRSNYRKGVFFLERIR